MIWREIHSLRHQTNTQLGSVLLLPQVVHGGWTRVVTAAPLTLPQTLNSTDSTKQHEHKLEMDRQTAQI